MRPEIITQIRVCVEAAESALEECKTITEQEDLHRKWKFLQRSLSEARVLLNSARVRSRLTDAEANSLLVRRALLELVERLEAEAMAVPL